MAEESTQQHAGGEQNIQVNLDERDMRTLFANAYRVHTTAEEVVLDLGFNMPDPNPRGQGQGQHLLFRVSDRVIMSYANTKRLAMSLGQLVKRYEQQFGEIPVQQGQPQPRK